MAFLSDEWDEKWKPLIPHQKLFLKLGLWGKLLKPSELPLISGGDRNLCRPPIELLWLDDKLAQCHGT